MKLGFTEKKLEEGLKANIFNKVYAKTLYLPPQMGSVIIWNGLVMMMLMPIFIRSCISVMTLTLKLSDVNNMGAVI